MPYIMYTSIYNAYTSCMPYTIYTMYTVFTGNMRHMKTNSQIKPYFQLV